MRGAGSKAITTPPLEFSRLALRVPGGVVAAIVSGGWGCRLPRIQAMSTCIASVQHSADPAQPGSAAEGAGAHQPAEARGLAWLS